MVEEAAALRYRRIRRRIADRSALHTAAAAALRLVELSRKRVEAAAGIPNAHFVAAVAALREGEAGGRPVTSLSASSSASHPLPSSSSAQQQQPKRSVRINESSNVVSPFNPQARLQPSSTAAVTSPPSSPTAPSAGGILRRSASGRSLKTRGMERASAAVAAAATSQQQSGVLSFASSAPPFPAPAVALYAPPFLSPHGVLAADAAAAMEAARAAVRSLLRAYQKVYPPLLASSSPSLPTLPLTAGSEDEEQREGDGAAAVLPKRRRPRINSSGVYSGLTAGDKGADDGSSGVVGVGTRSWCLSTIAKDLAAARSSQEADQRLRLDPAEEVVHPLSAAALTDNDIALAALYGERMAILRALAPLAARLRTAVSVAASADGGNGGDASHKPLFFDDEGVVAADGDDCNVFLSALLSNAALLRGASAALPVAQSSDAAKMMKGAVAFDTAKDGVQLTVAEMRAVLFGGAVENDADAAPAEVSNDDGVAVPLADAAHTAAAHISSSSAAAREVFRDAIASYTLSLLNHRNGRAVPPDHRTLSSVDLSVAEPLLPSHLTSASDSSAPKKEEGAEESISSLAAIISRDVAEASRRFARRFGSAAPFAAFSSAEAAAGPAKPTAATKGTQTSPEENKATAGTRGALKRKGAIGNNVAKTATVSGKKDRLKSKGEEEGEGPSFPLPQRVTFSTGSRASLGDEGDEDSEGAYDGEEAMRLGAASVMGEEEALQRATALIESWFQNDTDDGYGLGLGSVGAATYASHWDVSTTADGEPEGRRGSAGAGSRGASPTRRPGSGGSAFGRVGGGVSSATPSPVPTPTPMAMMPLPPSSQQQLSSSTDAAASANNTNVLLQERVRRLEDQLRTTKIKMSEYLKELFTQKVFSGRGGIGAGGGRRAAQRTVRVLISEPARFNLTREMPLPTQIVPAALHTGVSGAVPMSASRVRQTEGGENGSSPHSAHSAALPLPSSSSAVPFDLSAIVPHHAATNSAAVTTEGMDDGREVSYSAAAASATPARFVQQRRRSSCAATAGAHFTPLQQHAEEGRAHTPCAVDNNGSTVEEEHYRPTYEEVSSADAFSPPSHAASSSAVARRHVKGTRLVLLGASPARPASAKARLASSSGPLPPSSSNHHHSLSHRLPPTPHSHHRSNSTVSLSDTAPLVVSGGAPPSRPLSGAAVGLRQHLSAYARRQRSPVRDKGVGCDMGAEAQGGGAEGGYSRRLSNIGGVL